MIVRILAMSTASLFAISGLAILAAEPTAGGPWTYTETTDKFSDNTTATAAVKGRAGRLTFMFQCDAKNETSFTVVGIRRLGGEMLPVGIKRVPIDFRTDSNAASNFTLTGSAQFAFALQKDREPYEIMFAEIPSAKARILIRTVAIDGSVLEDQFSASGSSAAFARVVNACARP